MDYDSLTNLVEHLLLEGASGLIVLGSTGEFFGLTLDERKSLSQHVLKAVGSRVPVMVGTGSDSTATALELGRHAFRHGADSVLVQPPMYFDQSPQAQMLHFTHIASRLEGRICLYDGAGGVSLDVATIAQLASETRNVRLIKVATLDALKIARLRQVAPDMDCLVGDDTMLYAGMQAGASGSATALGNVAPKQLRNFHASMERGDFVQAADVLDGLAPLVLTTAVPRHQFIAKYKLLLRVQGVIKTDAVRAPLNALSETEALRTVASWRKVKDTDRSALDETAARFVAEGGAA